MDDWQKELENIRLGIKEIHNDALDIVLTNYSGEFKQRVFTDTGSKNSDDVSLGSYKNKYYASHRVALGRSGNPINLSFSGELERSIKVVNIDDDTALVVTPVQYVNNRFYKNPNVNTDQVSTYIDKEFGETFEPTKDELENNNKLLNTIIEEKFNELIK